MPMRLKDGSITSDSRLDRLVEFDERSRSYPLTEVLAPHLRPRGYTWRITKNTVLDQGPDGSCVGFAVANELLARPAEVRFGSGVEARRFAKEDIYWEAQKIDPWPGGSYPGADPFYEGTSILAGVKVAQRIGYFLEYRWTFNLHDLVIGLGYNGPAVVGVNWTTDMYYPDSKGFVRPTGNVVGGHAILARGVKLKFNRHNFDWWNRTWEDVDIRSSYVRFRNSWGPGYGLDGDFKMTLLDLDVLLDQRGESVFFIKRTSKV